MSYIYGANGAGKSYFCKIIRQIQSIILLSPILASGNTQLIDSLPLKELSSEIPTFRFSKAYEDSPTLFGISLMHKSVSYTYEFSIKNGIIISERLQKKFRRTETILERVSPSYLDISLKSELSSFLPNISVVKEDVLCLSMAAFLNNSLANELVSAIREIKVLNMATIKAGFNISEEAFSRDRIVKYLKVLQKADPTMDDLEVSFKDKKVERQKFSQDDFENREVIRETAKLSIESSHKIFLNGEVVDYVKMPFLQTESSGTIKLFIILPHLFEILETGGTLVLDEIENGLHPILVKELISLFNNQKTNPNNSQLICTSHDLTLIEDGVRRDQVWIICKNDMGVSSIKRVSKLLSMRGKVNLKQKYIEGAFGKIPQNFFKQ
ncbi:AAA family ATPase [Anaerotignum propionicum]|uniref:ATPase AAA-type core domain-containing protein n=1 Tax=Anaerotignum propionicum DSM 1682 TaxID=991789 RepID=A0ABM5Y6U6_ANAPI|nr:ATP-binding protein [Anaerotignum propionicum]AMJ39777.1 hypothetical protein CPRO_01530 [Anaerotignum propionicum DSM 1682]